QADGGTAAMRDSLYRGSPRADCSGDGQGAAVATGEQEGDPRHPAETGRAECRKPKSPILYHFIASVTPSSFRISYFKFLGKSLFSVWVCLYTPFSLIQVLLSSQSQLNEAEEENSRLQMRVKELNEEYRARLVHYLQDLSGGGGPPEKAKLRGFVDSMLQEVRASYRAREEQLATAARSYKKRLQRIIRSHQALLIAYRLTPLTFFATLYTVVDCLSYENNKLHYSTHPFISKNYKNCCTVNSYMTSLLSNQEGLVGERAQLISRATVAEQQVLELQENVDKHLGRYKKEITRLRRLLGLETGPAHSTGAPKP
uniref:Coiled-coil domain containing 78 n=1 Tax=Esox lucius TaxID=8010 RepID=A0AAY5L2N9_ESOLU